MSILLSEIKIGDEAPTFYVRTLDEKDFFLSDSLKNNQRPIVFSFFATWCIPCRQEIPVLDFLRKNQPVDPKILVNKFKRFDLHASEKEGKVKFSEKHKAWTLPDYPDD